MEKRTFLIISITAIIIVVISVLAVYQLVLNTNSNPAVSTIDHSDTYATISTVFQRKTFLYDGKYWLFYCNGTNLFYTTSTDGLNWRTPTAIGSGLSASAMSVWLENGTVQFTSTSGINVPVFYRVGQITGDEITWENEQQVVLGAPTLEYYNAYSTVDSEGRPWVTFIQSENDFPDSWFTIQVARADSPNGGHWNPSMQITENSITPFRPSLVSLPDEKMYAIIASQDGVEGRLWTGTSWQGTETVTDRHPISDFSFSAVSLNDEVHLVFVENATNNVYHCKRLSTGEWQETLVSVAGDSVAAVLSIDSARNTLYCLWIDGNTLHARKMENGAWSDITIQNLSLTSPVALSSFYEVEDGKLGVALLESLAKHPLVYRLRYCVIKDL